MTLDDISKLSDDELRVKVAELCGWTHCKLKMPESNYSEFFFGPSGIDPETGERHSVPWYASSLDDIHAAMLAALEEPEGWYVFAVHLTDVLSLKGCRFLTDIDETVACIKASARDLTIAFIATKEGVR